MSGFRTRGGRAAGVVLVNLIATVLGLLLLDVIVTKVDTIPLGAAQDGIARVGFASPVEVFGPEASGEDDSRLLTVAVIGDSHQQFTEDLRETHQSVVLHRELEKAGVSNRIVSLGTPRHSPIQELVAYEELIEPEDPDVAVFLLYGGNDLADILRADDRPRAERDPEGGARIADPVWLLSRVPGEACTEWPRDSRLLYLANGFRPNNWLLKVIAAYRSVEVLDVPLSGKVELIRNLKRFTDARLGYPGAIPAQFLYQAYLFHRYPEAFQREASWRMETFFREFAARFPDTPLYLFFLPSAAGVDAVPPEDVPVLGDVLRRTGLEDLDLAATETAALEIVRDAALRSGTGCRVVDLSTALRAAVADAGAAGFYDAPTIHVDVPARRIVGEEIARTLLAGLSDGERSGGPSRPPSTSSAGGTSP